MFQTNPSKTMTEFAKYTVRRYSELDLDGEPCFQGVGSVEVAATPERWKDLKRRHGLATSWGIESELISPEECVEKVPLIDPAKIYGGFFVPSDGIAMQVRACEAMARLATERGAKFYGETEVTNVIVKDGRVSAVGTDRGRIETEIVVSCAGMRGPKIGRMVGMRVPFTPMQHQLVWTTPLAELEGETREVTHSLLRHQDHAMYFRHRRDHYGVGSYQHPALPVSPDEIPHWGQAEVMPSVMVFTPEDFEPSWREAKDLMPALRNVEMDEPFNGSFSFTPDGMSLMGESREARGFWVTGAGALKFLQRLTTGQLDKPAGKVTYTLMLDEAGGVRSDITVARLDEHRFQVGLNGPRDIEWMERRLPADGTVQVQDITPGTCCVGVWGLTARDVVQSLSEDDFSNEAFGFFNARRAYLREVPVTALRLSYVGDLRSAERGSRADPAGRLRSLGDHMDGPKRRTSRQVPLRCPDFGEPVSGKSGARRRRRHVDGLRAEGENPVE